jgi:hypothetical protein
MEIKNLSCVFIVCWAVHRIYIYFTTLRRFFLLWQQRKFFFFDHHNNYGYDEVRVTGSGGRIYWVETWERDRNERRIKKDEYSIKFNGLERDSTHHMKLKSLWINLIKNCYEMEKMRCWKNDSLECRVWVFTSKEFKSHILVQQILRAVKVIKYFW